MTEPPQETSLTTTAIREQGPAAAGQAFRPDNRRQAEKPDPRTPGGAVSIRSRSEGQAAVDGQHLTRDVRTVGAGEEDRHAGDVVRLAQAPHRDRLLDAVAGDVAHRLTHVRLDEPRRDR